MVEESGGKTNHLHSHKYMNYIQLHVLSGGVEVKRVFFLSYRGSARRFVQKERELAQRVTVALKRMRLSELLMTMSGSTRLPAKWKWRRQEEIQLT